MYTIFEESKLSKREVLGNLMYELVFKDSTDFEADGESFTAYKTDKGFTLQGVNGSTQVSNKSELRKAIRNLGKSLVQL